MSLRPDNARQQVTAGKRDRNITLQRYVITYNEDNEPIEGWADLAKVKAAVNYVSDAERVRAAEVGASITVRFQTAYSAAMADLDAKDRVLFEGRLFDIVGVKPLGRREGFEISAAAPSDEAVPTP
jgi:SPP1 family predicted phage head-tail adaptor